MKGLNTRSLGKRRSHRQQAAAKEWGSKHLTTRRDLQLAEQRLKDGATFITCSDLGLSLELDPQIQLPDVLHLCGGRAWVRDRIR